MRYLIIISIIFLSVNLFSSNLWKGRKRYAPAKSLATAGAQNIGADKTDSAYLNPATLITKDRKYMMSFNALYTNSALPTQFMISAVDSRTSAIAGGAYVKYYSYNKEISGKKINYNTLEMGLSYGYPIFGGLVIGLGGRYYKFTENDKTSHAGTFDLGMTYRFSPYIKVGVVGYNLANIDYVETPMSVVSGISIGDSEMFLLNFDFVADFSAPKLYNKSGSATYEYHTGIQISPTDSLSLLGGYEVNKVLDDNFWSLGFEWFIPESRVEFTFGYLQSTTKNNKYFSFDTRLYF